LAAAAAASGGALFGFAFGIPRTLDPTSRAAVATAMSQGGSAGGINALMAANTNFERASDWLTTLLIGATLVQITRYRRLAASERGCSQGGTAANDAIMPVKPVQMLADIMLDCTARGELVLDPFLGSGSSIIAAERVGRKLRAIEIDPRYVDLAIRRWQRHSGDQAVHAKSGLKFGQVE
jgi:adenine-specific DNA methylase